MSFLDNTRKPDGLSSEKICAGGQIQLVFLRVGRNIGGSIGSDRTIHEDPSFANRMCSRVSGLNFGQQPHQRFCGLAELELLGL